MATEKKYKSLSETLTIIANIPIAGRDAKLAHLEAQRQKASNYERYTHCGVPKRYWQESFDTFITADASHAIQRKKQAALDFMRNDFMQAVQNGGASFVALLGNCGTGKTHLAAATLRDTAGTFTLSSQLVTQLRQARSYSTHKNEAALLQEYALPRVLVIDEVGRADNAADEKYTLYQIINARYNVEKPLIITANMSKPDFITYIGEAAADRFIEYGQILLLDWNSYRPSMRGKKEGA